MRMHKICRMPRNNVRTSSVDGPLNVCPQIPGASSTYNLLYSIGTEVKIWKWKYPDNKCSNIKYGIPCQSCAYQFIFLQTRTEFCQKSIITFLAIFFVFAFPRIFLPIRLVYILFCLFLFLFFNGHWHVKCDAKRWRCVFERFFVFHWEDARENGVVNLEGECKDLRWIAATRKLKGKEGVGDKKGWVTMIGERKGILKTISEGEKRRKKENKRDEIKENVRRIPSKK